MLGYEKTKKVHLAFWLSVFVDPLQGMYTGLFTEAEFRSLGIMAPFVVDEVFIQLDRSFFLNNLDFLRGLCYSSSKMDLVARILEEATTFGYKLSPATGSLVLPSK